MADSPKQEKRHPGLLEDFIRETIVTHGLPWLAGLGKDRTEEGKRRARNKNYFADAMEKLRARIPNGQHDHDVIQDFTVNWLDNDTDREDFQVNAARVGGDEDAKLPDTVDFLQGLAQLPDHPAREAVVTAYGFIGARSVDMGERAMGLLLRVRDGITGMGKPVAGEVKAQLDAAITALDGITTAPAAEQKTADALTVAKNRFAAMKAKL